MLRFVLIALVALGGTALAQPRAVSVPSSEVHHPLRPEAEGLGGSFFLGSAGQRNGPSGWSARIDFENFKLFPHDGFGGIVGSLHGLEVWSSGEDNWGFSLPVGFIAGVRAQPLRAMIGGGIDAILVDQVDDDTGFGFYAPFALARVGFDIDGFQVGADARVGYRWQIGADDHTRWQVGFFIAKTMPQKPKMLRKPVAIAQP
jgi:hypothetical protein